MKRKMRIVLLCVALALAACGQAPPAEPVLPQDAELYIEQPTPDEEESIIVDSDHDVIQMYIDVLQSSINFHEGAYAGWPSPQYFQSDYISLADYLIKIGDGITWEATEFAVVDMTGNGTNDIVLSLIHPQIMENVLLVLVYENGDVYSNIFTSRNMFSIKKDGTYFRRASGQWNVTRLSFSAGIFSSEEILQSPNFYYYHDDFMLFVEDRDNIEYARWLPFSTETIAEDLLIAWHSNLD